MDIGFVSPIFSHCFSIKLSIFKRELPYSAAHRGETVVLRKAGTLTLIVDVIVPLDTYCGVCAACVCLLQIYEADDREKQEGGLLRGKHDEACD